MKKRTTLALALTVGLGMVAQASIIQPVSATGPAGDAGSSVTAMINDAGLRDGADAATTLATGATLATAQATNHRLDGTGHVDSWTLDGTTPAVFVFDLGAETTIGTAILWQYGNDEGTAGLKGNSTRDFELIFHTAAEGNTFDFGTEAVEFSGTMTGATGQGSANNTAQTFQFLGETSQFVALRIVNNIGNPPGDAGGDRLGLGEVRFATEVIPEPATLGLVAVFGGAVLFMRRKMMI